MSATRLVAGVGAVAEEFDAFILDQFGVLHDGRRPYPGALDALRRLKAAGKRIVILSNSGRRAAPNAERLTRHGVTANLYDGLVTSGEAAWEQLRDRTRTPWSGLGRRALLIARGGDRSLVEGTGLETVETPTEADFILLAGGRDGWTRLEDYASLLSEAAARGLLLICANPDRASIGADGLEVGPGAVAEAYGAAGGPTHFVGKPWGDVYDACLARLGGMKRILAVGDSLAHDVRGAKDKGMFAMLVATGVSAPHFAGAEFGLDRLEGLIESEGVRPDFLAPDFRW